MTDAPPKPRRRKGLTRARILAEAVTLADAEGIGAVSMRKLAARLGVEAMSLYNHVGGKDDLAAGMADLVVGSAGTPGDGPWRDEVHTAAHAIRTALARHPWAVPLLAAMPPGPRRLAHAEATRARLAEAGLDAATAASAQEAIEALAIGCAAMGDGGTEQDGLEFGLGLILEGLERLRS